MNERDTPIESAPGHISGDQNLPEIRRARFQRLTIFEVEESELLILERGAPDSILLNIAVGLLTLALTLTATLIIAAFPSARVWTVFLAVAVIGYMVGLILILIWWRSRVSVSACVQNIRQRLPTGWLEETEPGALP